MKKYLFRELDYILDKYKSTKKLTIEEFEFLLNLNLNATEHFYSIIDEEWLGWLWDNGFLDVVKQIEDLPEWRNKIIPELVYLSRMSEVIPDQVEKIVLDILTSKEICNPEVIDYLSKLIYKIKNKKMM